MMTKKRLLIILSVLILLAAARGAFLYLKRPVEAEIKAPKIALVLDDFGYNMNNLNEVFRLGVPVTISILPDLSYSEKIAREAKQKKYQTILHLPLEPKEEDLPLEKTTIFCGMDKRTILSLLKESLAGVPGISGISNHMGSRATADARVMRIIFKMARKHRLFFLDNMVTPDSVCGELAAKAGIKYAQRDIFLDNQADLDYIKGQIDQLRRAALDNGQAVGVGHDRALTISAIKEMIPQIEKDGIRFVFVSELAK